jgi:hypothetical protein
MAAEEHPKWKEWNDAYDALQRAAADLKNNNRLPPSDPFIRRPSVAIKSLWITTIVFPPKLIEAASVGGLITPSSSQPENHAAAVSPYVSHYNLCRVHEALTPSAKHQTTPAMALALTAHPWSIGELLDAALTADQCADAPQSGRAKAGSARLSRHFAVRSQPDLESAAG